MTIACSEQTNVNALVDVTLLVRASLHITKTAAPGAPALPSQTPHLP